MKAALTRSSYVETFQFSADQRTVRCQWYRLFSAGDWCAPLGGQPGREVRRERCRYSPKAICKQQPTLHYT